MAAPHTLAGRSSARPAERAQFDRQLPHSLEAERAVLGSMLINPHVCDDVALLIGPGDFYAPAHQTLCEQILALHERGTPVDDTILVERLKSEGKLEAVGGILYLAEVARAVPTAANAVHYARIVLAKATYRALILAGTDIAGEAYDEELDSRDLLNRAEERIFAIHDNRWAGEVAPIHDVLQDALSHLAKRLEHGQATGVPTDFKDFDSLTGGLHESELVILAARPSMGKTALATCIAENVSLKAKTTTLFVSLEMSRLELAQRMLCSHGRINGRTLRAGRQTKEDTQKLIEASGRLSQAPLFVDDTPSRTVSEIAAAARRIKRRHKLGLIIIDYLQLIEPDNPKDQRQEQVAKIARRLKGLARELKTPVLCLAQLNRQAEISRDSRPRLSHLRESGAIEQDADVVMFVHRDEYYLSDDEKRDESNRHLLGVAEIIIAKQRNGPVGQLKLCWREDFTRFEDLAREEYTFEGTF